MRLHGIDTPEGFIDYPRISYEYRQHHERFKVFVKEKGLFCQECGGSGGEMIPVLDDGSGPFETCGWCEGTGLVTPFIRGAWLSYRKEQKQIKLGVKTR